MAEVAAAAAAADLNALHAVAVVSLELDVTLVGGRDKAGPAATGVVLRVGQE